MRQAVISGPRVLDYIPQRPPVVMVDTFYGIEESEGEGQDEGVSLSGFTVPTEHLFVDPRGVLDQCALIENMAQSAALRVGWLCARQGRPVPTGLIGSVGKCRFTRSVHAGDRLLTSVRVIARIGGVTMAETEVKLMNGGEDGGGGELVAASVLKIFLAE